MTTPRSIEFLQRQIDLISVPVVIADECDNGDFRVAAINSAHARMTGLKKTDVHGRTPFELMADPVVAREIVAHYRHCIEAEGPVSFRERMTCDGQCTDFDVTLNKIALPGSKCFRIVGTSLKVAMPDRDTDDIQFYASLARHSLTTVEMLMNASALNQPLSLAEREAVLILCRKAMLSLDDIDRSVARSERLNRGGGSELSTAVRDLLLH